MVGDDFTVRTVETAAGYLYQFWHKQPMRRGQTYDLSCRIVNLHLANDPYWLHEESLAFHGPTRFATFEAVFLGAVAPVAWSFRVSQAWSDDLGSQPRRRCSGLTVASKFGRSSAICTAGSTADSPGGGERRSTSRAL